MKRSFAQINAEPSSELEDTIAERTREGEPARESEHIQFFGSANTQTQSHAYNNDPLSVPVFQKENVQSTLHKPQSLQTPMSPASPPLRDPANALRPHYSVDMTLPATGSVAEQMVMSGNAALPSSIKPTSDPHAIPSSLPLLHDSFGDPVPVDPARALLASDAFQKPISQLGQSTEDSDSNSIPFSRSPTPTAPPKNYVRSSPIPSPRHKRPLGSEFAAPLTDEESHHTENEQETQVVTSQAMSSPSSSYARYIDGKRDSTPPADEDIIATQTDNPSARCPTDEPNEDPFAQYGLTSSTAAPDPYHIQFYQQVAGESQSQEDEIATQPTGAAPSDDEDEVTTQPTFEPRETAQSAPVPTPAPEPVNDQVARQIINPSIPKKPEPNRPASQDSDAMDIVPDSEPPRQGERSSPVQTPPQTPVAPHTPAKAVSRKTPKKTPRKSADDTDIVPDSVAEADDTTTENGDEDMVAEALAFKSPDVLRQEEEEGEEEDDDDDDDIPLAKMVGGANTHMLPPPPVSKEKLKGPRKTKSEPKPTARATRGKQLPADDFVPSSLPEQDKTKPTVTGKGKGKQVSKAERESRSSSIASTVTQRPRRVSMDNDSRGKYYESPESDGEPPSEDYDDEPDNAPSTSKKRKRVAVVTATKVKSEPQVAKRLSKQTPARKRTRLVESESSTDYGTKVIALWKGNGQYYTGHVHSREGENTFQIYFDDGERATVPLEQMRLLEFRIGDEVKVDKNQGTVVDVDDMDTKKQISVNTKRGTVDTKLAKVSILSRNVQHAWRDRMLDADRIIPAIQPISIRTTATPSKQSLVSPSPNGIFAQDAFILTANGDGGKDKAANLIKRHGGTIFEHWGDILALAGSYRNNKKNWHIESENIHCKLNGAKSKLFTRLFLIAADVKLTPKYMVALALGVPCISEDWIHESVKTEGSTPWSSHLLPQGRCESLQVTVSQRVDLNWCDSTQHIQQLWISNPLRSTVFEGHSVLLLGKFIPPIKQNDKHPHTYVPCIVACMGAEYVEAAENLSTVSRKPSTFDYIVIHEKSDYKSHKSAVSTARRVITVRWVKDSLVMGRPMPLEELDT